MWPNGFLEGNNCLNSRIFFKLCIVSVNNAVSTSKQESLVISNETDESTGLLTESQLQRLGEFADGKVYRLVTAIISIFVNSVAVQRMSF